MKERTFTLNGMSKAYSMTGWRLGYVSAPEEYILAMNKIHQHNVTCAPSFVQKASIAALRDETDEVEKMVVEYQRRRDYAVKAINEIPGLSCRCPKVHSIFSLISKTLVFQARSLRIIFLKRRILHSFREMYSAHLVKAISACPLQTAMKTSWKV